MASYMNSNFEVPGKWSSGVGNFFGAKEDLGKAFFGGFPSTFLTKQTISIFFDFWSNYVLESKGGRLFFPPQNPPRFWNGGWVIFLAKKRPKTPSTLFCGGSSTLHGAVEGFVEKKKAYLLGG